VLTRTCPAIDRAFERPTIERILALLRDPCGMNLVDSERGMLERRIERRMVLHGIDVPSTYLERLEKDPRETALLYADLLAGTSAFFPGCKASSRVSPGATA
jgi:chemotaxis methyl-accepting protein methylase